MKISRKANKQKPFTFGVFMWSMIVFSVYSVVVYAMCVKIDAVRSRRSDQGEPIILLSALLIHFRIQW